MDPVCPDTQLKICKSLSSETKTVCETCDASGNTICLDPGLAEEKADTRPPKITTAFDIKMPLGEDGDGQFAGVYAADALGNVQALSYV